MSKKYFYGRVSTKDQNLARQLAAARAYTDIPEENIYCDKESGKNFEREQYQALKEQLLPGDELIVKELDRLGRNKEETKDELKWMKEHRVIVRILDLPTTLMEYPVGQEWVLEMVNNILIEVLGTIAEQEREKIKARQAEGIAEMPIIAGKRVSAKTGRGFGRPEKNPDNFFEVLQRQRAGEISLKDALTETGLGRTRWYELARQATV